MQLQCDGDAVDVVASAAQRRTQLSPQDNRDLKRNDTKETLTTRVVP